MSLGSAAHMMGNRLRSLGRVPGATGGWPDVGHVVIAAAPLRRRLRFDVFTDPPLNLSERHRWLTIIASSPTALVILKVRPVLVIRKPVAGCIYDPTAMISDHWQNDALMGFEIPDRWVSAC